MDYDGLRMFLELSRSLHFLRASRACHVSPSTLSRAVQRLEQETGCAAARTRPALGAADRRRRTVRRARARHAGTLAAAAARPARPPRHAVGDDRDLRVGHGLPELPPRAARRLPRAATPTSTSSSRPATRPTRSSGSPKGSVDVSVAAIPPQLPRGLVSRVLLYTPLVFAAPRVACEVERLCHQRPLPWTSCRSCCPRRATRARAPTAGSAAGASCRRSTARSRAARRSSRSSAWAAASASCRASSSTRAPCAASSACSTPMTAAPRWANSASASAPSARSSRRPWCARCGTRSPPCTSMILTDRRGRPH